MATSFYLEHYLDTLEPLPGELRRNFTLMREMDEKNKKILQEVDMASDDYIRKIRELSPDSRKDEMEKIQKMFKKAKEYGDEKVSIAIQTYELVDKYIRRLDGDLAKFEAEMREKGRLSQAETEDEEEEEQEEEESTKKRGRKKAKNDSNSTAKKKKSAGKDTNDDEVKGSGKKKSKKGNKGSEQPSTNAVVAAMTAMPQEIIDMPVDPNEPTYCMCHQVSYGEMIGCDNTECPIEWFHFGCMKLTTKPKGKWYCPKCLPLFKKKK